jgi:hypothetical protein
LACFPGSLSGFEGVESKLLEEKLHKGSAAVGRGQEEGRVAQRYQTFPKRDEMILRPIINMNIIFVALLSFLYLSVHCSELFNCIKNSFNGSCKLQIYACTNNPECSYQLHQNTQHIFLDEKSEVFPPLYFSNKIAVDLYTCLKGACSLPAMDENYPKTLPFDFCLI